MLLHAAKSIILMLGPTSFCLNCTSTTFYANWNICFYFDVSRSASRHTHALVFHNYDVKPALRTVLLYFQNKTTAYFRFIYIMVRFRQHKNLTKVKNKCHKNIKTYTQKLQQNEITAGHHCAILQSSLSCLFGTDTSCNCCNECKYESQFCVWCKACTVLFL